jgi:uncharacterized RDD family membrane protein YckC
MQPNVRDPREIITPESFAIDPALLGLPLARPMRRAAAMLIDLLIIALLVHAGGLLFGVAAAWVFLRVSGKSAGGGLLRRSWRFAFRSLAALVLFLVVLSSWGSWRRPEPARPSSADALAHLESTVEGEDLAAYRAATTEEDALAAADRLASRLRERGFDRREIRRMLAAAADETSQPWAVGVAREVAAGPLENGMVPGAAADSLLQAHAFALSSNDTARAAELRGEIRRAFAADTAAVLQARLQRSGREAEALQSELDEARQGWGILAFLRNSADDLGLTFGWSGLYFTAFLALWHGQTPGKRAMRIRVVRLDGKPMTWWAAFERFGGYAASIFTGLLGFLQILWDRNRQGMHDKITETVVVRE